MTRLSAATATCHGSPEGSVSSAGRSERPERGIARFVPRRVSLRLATFAVAAAVHGLPASAAPGGNPVGTAVPPSDVVRFLWPEADARLTDQSNHGLASPSLDDKVVAVTFFDTHCSITCVVRTLDLATVARELSGNERSHLVILAISRDSARDDPAALATFATAMRLDTTAVTLLASDAEAVEARMKLIRFHAAPRAIDPIPSTVFVFDRRGRMVMRYGGEPVDKRRLRADLATLVQLDRGAGAPASSTPSSPSATSK